jgi:uncharacterized paraquat-inducible protein A
MNRRLATALASAAFLTFVSVPAALTGAQSAQEGQPVERTGQKMKKDVQTSCPVHPEIKARTAEKCPKCRAELRKQKGARDRDKNKVQPQQQQGAPAND